MLNCHDTHCCIDHGCKYGEEDCPVANGVRKQCYPCEMCGLETEDYYGKPDRTEQEQKDYCDALWNEKNNPRPLTDSLEISVAELAKRYGRTKLLNILQDLGKIPLTINGICDILNKLKGIK